MSPDESDLFYQNAKTFEDFNGIIEEANFITVPDDWYVVITDIKGSTKAIDAGRYRDVNTVGAAAIVCVQNAMGDLEYPFVFGGDGATLLIPKCGIEKVRDALIGLKMLSRDQFDLGLRVGVVPVKVLSDEGIPIRVAKYKLIGKKSVAIFRGGGLTAAEDKIKGTDQYELPESGATQASLQGLSCRWQPIPSKRGIVLSLLVVARTKNQEGVYRDVLSNLNDAFGGAIEEANPVNIPQLSYKSVSQMLKDEAKFHRSKWSLGYLFRALEIFGAFLVFKLRVPALYFNTKEYTESMRSHSDYRKFDDALRMIIDCTPEQVASIRQALDQGYEKGELFYGLHESGASLMTCHVDNLKEGNHIHFIDGGDGGYAMAAKQLKGQMKGAQGPAEAAPTAAP
jgi:hypothetical protein